MHEAAGQLWPAATAMHLHGRWEPLEVVSTIAILWVIACIALWAFALWIGRRRPPKMGVTPLAIRADASTLRRKS